MIPVNPFELQASAVVRQIVSRATAPGAVQPAQRPRVPHPSALGASSPAERDLYSKPVVIHIIRATEPRLPTPVGQKAPEPQKPPELQKAQEQKALQEPADDDQRPPLTPLAVRRMRLNGAQEFDTLMAKFMSESKWAVSASVLQAHGSESARLSQLLRPSSRPPPGARLDTWARGHALSSRMVPGVRVAIGLNGTDSPCFKADLIGMLHSVERPDDGDTSRLNLLKEPIGPSLVFQVHAPAQELQWRGVILSSFIGSNMSQLIVAEDKFSQFTLHFENAQIQKARTGGHPPAFVSPSQAAKTLKDNTSVMLMAEWRNQAGRADLCLPAQFVQQTRKVLIFQAGWAPPTRSPGGRVSALPVIPVGADYRTVMPQNSLDLTDGMWCDCRAESRWEEGAGDERTFKFSIARSSPWRVRIDPPEQAGPGSAATAKIDSKKPAPVWHPVQEAHVRGTRLGMQDVRTLREGDALFVDDAPATYLSLARKPDEFMVRLMNGNKVKVRPAKSYVELR